LSDRYRPIMPSHNGDSNALGELGAYEDFAVAEDRSADFVPSLVSLGFFKAALRRSARFLCLAAIAGLIAGLGAYLATPHPDQASTTLLLPLGNSSNITSITAFEEVVTDNQTTAQSRSVAGLVIRNLGLRQSVDSFLSSYSATSVTDRVLVITASASSSDQAVLRANAIAKAFLQVRADELLSEQELTRGSLEQQIGQVEQNISSLARQISRLAAEPASPGQQSQLSSLRAESSQATSTLTALQRALVSEQTNTQPATAVDARGAVVLDAATPLPHSWLKHLLLYALIGLVVGVVLGVAVVVFRALLSNRLRRRDDVAQALGAPVKLSVGRVRPSRQGVPRDPDIQRIAAYLDRAVPTDPGHSAALAVVPVDDPRAAASSLVSLALSRAQQGEYVVLADLATGAPAARLLGFREHGVREVSVHNTRLTVAVPEGDDVLPPTGPLGRAQVQGSPFTDAVTAACARANLLLTLATLDVSFGGDHLATWATDAVAVITAGRSSWATISAAGEMVRLSGTRLVSAVLIGADHSDESLGVTYTSDSHEVEAPLQDGHSNP
jgi:capsular polysaccharide biosynthesis protein